MEISEVKFANSGGLNIAYQRFGSGPDVVVIPGLVSNVELSWEQEVYRRAREHCGRYVRILEFDKRGIGSSDRFEGMPTLEERIGDIHAVMDAEGVQRASILGISEGGMMAQLFAAMHPERVDRLILATSLVGESARDRLQAYAKEPIDPLEEVLGRVVHMIDTWGREPEAFVDLFCPSLADDPAFVRWAARFQRQTASPADIRRQLDSVLRLDANDRLAAIKAPTLVMNVFGDRIVPPAAGRFLADQIPDAEYFELPGQDHLFFVNANWRLMMDRWLEFVTGVAPVSKKVRRFATVLFTDIVGSTARVTQLGDQAWRATMEQHDRIAWKMVDRHNGQLVKNTGDGLLLTFDNPSDGIGCAADLQRELAGEGLTIRAGLHAGEVEVRQDGDVTGLCVNLAARVQAVASDGATYVSSTMRDLLLGGDAAFEDRGEHTLKGIDGKWRLYRLAQ